MVAPSARKRLIAFCADGLQVINQVAGLLLVGFGLLLIGEIVAKRLGLL